MIELRLRCSHCLRSMVLADATATTDGARLKVTGDVPAGWDGIDLCPACVALGRGVPEEDLPRAARLALGVLK